MKDYASLLLFLLFTTFLNSEPYIDQKLVNRNVSQNLPKRDLRGSQSENFSSRKASLIIQADKNRFYSSENIPLHLTIKNRGSLPITLYLHRNFLNNFNIIVRDKTGRSLPVRNTGYKQFHNLDTKFKNYTGTDYHSRAITLQPAERLTRTIHLKSLIDLQQLTEEKSRVDISAFFYPNPMQQPDLFLEAENSVSILIDKQQYNQLMSQRLSKRPMLTDKSNRVSPKEIVYLALTAEYMKDWPNYFKYFSMVDIIKAYPEFAREYVQRPAQMRAEVIEKFRKYLKQRNTHKLIRFKVSEADMQYSNRRLASVKVDAVRILEGFKREFTYTFYLTETSRKWYITGIEAQLIK